MKGRKDEEEAGGVCDRFLLHQAVAVGRTTGREVVTPLAALDVKQVTVPLSCSIGHPPHSSASPVELRLRVGPRALSGKKKELREQGVLKFVCP